MKNEDETPVGLPHCLQRGPNGKLNGRSPEEMIALSSKAHVMRIKRKEWKAEIREAIRTAAVRPADIIRNVFESEEDSMLRKLAYPVKLRAFLQNIPGIGAKKAETLLIIAQISNARGKYSRRISYLVKESIRKRFLEALDAWYDQYQMEKQYKRKRDLPPHKRKRVDNLKAYRDQRRLKKLNEPKLVDEETKESKAT